MKANLQYKCISTGTFEFADLPFVQIHICTAKPNMPVQIQLYRKSQRTYRGLDSFELHLRICRCKYTCSANSNVPVQIDLYKREIRKFECTSGNTFVPQISFHARTLIRALNSLVVGAISARTFLLRMFRCKYI